MLINSSLFVVTPLYCIPLDYRPTALAAKTSVWYNRGCPSPAPLQWVHPPWGWWELKMKGEREEEWAREYIQPLCQDPVFTPVVCGRKITAKTWSSILATNHKYNRLFEKEWMCFADIPFIIANVNLIQCKIFTTKPTKMKIHGGWKKITDNYNTRKIKARSNNFR